MEMKVELGRLVLDFALYPRANVDDSTVARLGEALDAGAELPPPLVEKKSLRVLDGFHRVRLYQRKYPPEYLITVQAEEFKDEAAMFLRAVEANAAHGRPYAPYDRAHALVMAGQMHIPDDLLAKALHLKVERMIEIRQTKTASVGRAEERVAIKTTICHMADKKLTRGQVAANERLGGMRQLFYVNQVLILIENDLLDTSDDAVMEAIARLHQALEGLVVLA